MRESRLDFRRLARRACEPLTRRFVLDWNSDARRTVVVAGTRRSGTTWIADIINHRNAYRDVFEPFHPTEVALCHDFLWRQYLRPDDAREPYLGAARAILAGRVHGRWVNTNNRRVVARRRLVKDIRINLLLGWLRRHFPEVPLIVVLRHPCAVALSGLRHGWDFDLGIFLGQQELVEDLLGPVADVLRAAHDEFERNVCLWCVETLVALRQLGPADCHVVFYERLCTTPEVEVPRLLDRLDDTDHAHALARFKIPSRMSAPTSAIHVGGSLVESWRAHVSPAQLERAHAILRAFHLDALYGPDALPDPAGIAAVRNAW